ncbi:MAG TPA: PA14 domain-containing protein [Bryobacteraceae bacterium]|nr:PA14 domain-containing protein [Bryobacteraceae bacterium]
MPLSRRFLLLFAAVLPAQTPPEQAVATFGTTVASSSGLQGDIYLLKPTDDLLPNFRRKKPVGSIYTTSLAVTPRSFEQGFPGITDRFEWFAIDYKGKFWVEQAGVYQFRLLSDDGSKLWLNGSLVIDNDGEHPPQHVDGNAELSRGVHTLRVAYFQGPRAQVALMLYVLRPGDTQWRLFDTNDFRPPPDPAQWTEGTVKKVKRGSNQ